VTLLRLCGLRNSSAILGTLKNLIDTDIEIDVTRISLTCYEEIGRVGRVHEDATRKLLLWNLGNATLRSTDPSTNHVHGRVV